MASFKETRNRLRESHFDGVIDDDEFLLSCDANTSKNPVFPCDNYRRFSLDNMDP